MSFGKQLGESGLFLFLRIKAGGNQHYGLKCILHIFRFHIPVLILQFLPLQDTYLHLSVTDVLRCPEESMSDSDNDDDGGLDMGVFGIPCPLFSQLNKNTHGQTRQEVPYNPFLRLAKNISRDGHGYRLQVPVSWYRHRRHRYDLTISDWTTDYCTVHDMTVGTVGSFG